MIGTIVVSAVLMVGAGGPRRPPPRFEAVARSDVRRVTAGGGEVGRRGEDGGDRWLAEDKLKHCAASFGATSMAYAGVRALGVAHRGAVVVAAGVGAGVGVGKEAYDRATGGDVSLRDLAWDAVGVAMGTLLSAHSR